MTKKHQAPPDWSRAALELAAVLPLARWHPAVLGWVERAARTSRWSVAFSGGADSLALLLLLWAHWPARRARLQALHFNHRLRGAESNADARFCRKVCAALGIGCVVESWATARRGASEAEARAARHRFFRRHSRVLWLGHQQDDIAETMLMRLSRGSGLGGLAAPRPVQTMPRRRVHLRPLLTHKKKEIVAALRRCGVPWREDASNDGEAFFRNRVRRRVLLPWITASERDALAGAARSRDLLEEDDEALEAWLAELRPLEKRGARHVLSLSQLAGKPRGLVRRAVHGWLLEQPQAGALSRQGFDALLDAVQRGTPTRQSLGSAGFAVIARGRLSFVFDGKGRRKFQRSIN